MLYVSSSGILNKDEKSSGISSSLLVTTIVEGYDIERMKLFSDRFTDFAAHTKVLFLSVYTDYSIRDYMFFSREKFKVYNKFVDYKPFLVKSFVYLCNPIDKKLTSYEAFLWRCYFFSFVFAYEYDFANVLYVPFKYDMTAEECEYYVRSRANYTSGYKILNDYSSSVFSDSSLVLFDNSEFFLQFDSCQHVLQKNYPDLSSLLFVSYVDFMKFFDACFHELKFFSEKDLFNLVLSN